MIVIRLKTGEYAVVSKDGKSGVTNDLGAAKKFSSVKDAREHATMAGLADYTTPTEEEARTTATPEKPPTEEEKAFVVKLAAGGYCLTLPDGTWGQTDDVTTAQKFGTEEEAKEFALLKALPDYTVEDAEEEDF